MSVPVAPLADQNAAGQALLQRFAQRVEDRKHPVARPPDYSPAGLKSAIYAGLQPLVHAPARPGYMADVLYLFLAGHAWKTPQLGQSVGLCRSAVQRALRRLVGLGLLERRGQSHSTWYWLTPAGEAFLAATLPPPPPAAAPAEVPATAVLPAAAAPAAARLG